MNVCILPIVETQNFASRVNETFLLMFYGLRCKILRLYIIIHWHFASIH